MAFDPADEIAAQIKKEQEENNPDADDNTEAGDLDKRTKDWTGDEPADGEEVGFAGRQIKKDDEARANIPPEGKVD